MAQRIIFPEKSCVALENYAVEAPDSDDVLIRTLCSLISIGTETTVLHQRYDPDTHFAKQFAFPRTQTGNHALGVVEAVGADVESVKPGQRVFFRKAHGSHWVVPAGSCSAVPEDVSDDDAIWCGFAKIAFRGADAASFLLGRQTLIIGAGPVGQLAARWALSAGMRRVVLCDISANRLSLSPEPVVTVAGSVIEDHTKIVELSDGDGFESVIDSTGNPNVIEAALALAAPGGRVVLLGDTGFPARQRLTSDMMSKSLSVIAAHESHDRGGLSSADIDGLFFELAARGMMSLGGLITQRFSPGDFEEAYDLASDSRDEAVGILFDWSKE